MPNVSEMSDEELMALAGAGPAMPPVPQAMPAYDDIGVKDLYLGQDGLTEQKPVADLSQLSDADLMAAAGIEAPKPQAVQLQVAYDRKKAGLGERIAEGGKQRMGQIQNLANLAGEGTLGEKEAKLLMGLKTAQVPFDVAGEVLTSGFRALPDAIENPIRKGASYVNSVASSLPVMGGGTIGEVVPKELAILEKNNPAAFARLGGVADAGNILSGFLPVKGTNAIRTAGEVGEKALTKTGKTLAPVTNAAYDLTSLAPEQQMLQDLGVRLTPGQRSGGAILATENKATSIPIVGDSINSAYKRGLDDFNRVTADRVLFDIGAKLPKKTPIGHDAIAFTQDTISKSYDDVLSQMTGRTDRTLNNNIGKLKLDVAARLPKDIAKQTQSIIDDAFKGRVDPQGNIKGTDVKEIMSMLGAEATDYLSSSLPNDRKMGKYLMNAKDEVSQMLQRNNPVDLSDRLANTDASFAKFVRLQKAAVKGANNGGVFTPAQLMQAVRESDKSVRKGKVAKGEALMQDLATAGQKVLPNKYPDSGSIGRAIQNFGMGALLTGGAAAVSPAPLLAGALAAGAYTRPGQALLRGTSKVIRKKK